MRTENICAPVNKYEVARKQRDAQNLRACAWGAPTRPVSRRVVEEAEAQRQEDHRPPGDFTQQLQAADSSLLHRREGQHHRGPDDEDEPGGNNRGWCGRKAANYTN